MRNRLLGLLAGTAALTLATAAAQAADLPARTAPAPMIAAVPVFTWTGFYVGAQVGYQWNDNGSDDYYGYPYTVAYPYGYGFTDSNNDGFVAGAHVGYNFQFGSFVVGVEGDLEGVFGDDDNNDYPYYLTATPAYYGYNRHGSLDWQGSIRARAGFAFDRMLVYGTAGFAFGGGGDSNNGYYGYPYYYGGGSDDSVSGWTVGLGVEYAFTYNLTARVEYRYTSLDRGSNNYYLAAPVYYGNNNDDAEFHTIRAGISYKFGTY